MPSLSEIQRAVGYRLPRSVQVMLGRLEKRGFISYLDGVIEFSMKRAPWPWTTKETVAAPLVASREQASGENKRQGSGLDLTPQSPQSPLSEPSFGCSGKTFPHPVTFRGVCVIQG